MAVEQINKLFSEIVEMVRKIEADGIHSGCADDELLREARDIKQKTESFSYRNTDYFRYVEHYQNIREILSTKPWKGERVLDKILNSLYFEAIDNHINGVGVNCDKCHKFMGKCSYCPHCGKKLVPNEHSQLRITEDVGDVMDVYLSPDEYPETYKKKHTELVRSCGMTAREATELLKKNPIQLELFYSMDQGLFAVEAEAVECTSIYNPYNGAEIPNDNLS